MASEPFRNSNIQYSLPLTLPSNEAQGILEALSSHSSFKNMDNLGSDISMAELNMDLMSDVMKSTFLEKYSNSGSAVGNDADAALANLIVPPGAHMHPENTNIEPYMSLHSLPMSYTSNNPMSIFSDDGTLSYLCQGVQKEQIKQPWRSVASSTNLKSNLQNFQDSIAVQMTTEHLTPILKKPRCDINQENLEQQQQQMIQEYLLKELHDSNPQLMAMMEQHRFQNQLVLPTFPQTRGLELEPQLGKQLPKKQITSVLQDQGDQQGTFAPLLDGGICSRRIRQYLLSFRSHIQENDIGSWKKFVSEYYAPGSKKRRIGAVTYVVQDPEGDWAIFDTFPRLFKAKFESGMLDEILFLDSPRACKVSSGLMLEYGRVIQESVYEKFRVVHEGRLRIVFRNDLKIFSWEFCARHHEEYLLRESIVPQVNLMVQTVKRHLENFQNGTSSRMSSKYLPENYEMFDSARNQLARSIDLPLVNALGYPKRFIRTLQIAEVVESITDLMTLSQGTKMGPIECLNSYSQVSLAKQRMELFMGGGKNLISGNSATPSSGNFGLALANLNHRLLGESYNIPPLKRKGPDPCSMDQYSNQLSTGFAQSFNPLRKNVPPSYGLPRSQSAELGKSTTQSLFDKLLQEVMLAKKEKSMQETYGKQILQSNARRGQRCGGESSKAASAEANSADVIRAAGNIPRALSHGDVPDESRAVKAEPPLLPELKLEAQQGSGTGSGKIQSSKW